MNYRTKLKAGFRLAAIFSATFGACGAAHASDIEGLFCVGVVVEGKCNINYQIWCGDEHVCTTNVDKGNIEECGTQGQPTCINGNGCDGIVELPLPLCRTLIQGRDRASIYQSTR